MTMRIHHLSMQQMIAKTRWKLEMADKQHNICSSHFRVEAQKRIIAIHVCSQGIVACNNNKMRNDSLHFTL